MLLETGETNFCDFGWVGGDDSCRRKFIVYALESCLLLPIRYTLVSSIWNTYFIYDASCSFALCEGGSMGFGSSGGS
jgi:hypothetical protein